MNILSVDWDYFFPNPNEGAPYRDGRELMLYDWGHREAPFFSEGVLWDIRRDVFERNGYALPMTSGDEDGFWRRFRYTPDVRLYVADSHAFMATSEILEGGPPWTIWNYDAHHDGGYGDDLASIGAHLRGEINCGDWALYVHRGWPDEDESRIAWHRPPWAVRGRNEPQHPEWILLGEDDPEDRIDTIFVAKSPAWVPPWLDEGFLRFVASAPARITKVLSGINNPMLIRAQGALPREAMTS